MLPEDAPGDDFGGALDRKPRLYPVGGENVIRRFLPILKVEF